MRPAGSTVEARGDTETFDGPSMTCPIADAQAGKFVAFLEYLHGVASFEATTAKFSRHPEWRSA